MNRTIFIKDIILAVCLFAFLIDRTFADEPDSSLLRHIKKITIASEPDYPPYCIIDENGKADGFAVELFLAAAKAAGIETNVRIGVWDHIKQELAEGKIDALPFVGKTPERENLFDFTLPYLSLHGAIFVKKGTRSIKSLDDLKDKKIGVMKGDNAEEFVLRENLSGNVVSTFTFEEAFRMLESGVVDAVITQRLMGLELIKSLKLKKIVPLDIQLPKFRQDFCFAVKKGNTSLLSRLNEGLSIVIANKTYDELHLKWFGPKVKEKLSFYDITKILLLFLVPSILILSLLSIIFLRNEVKRRTQLLSQEVSEHKKTLQILHDQNLMLNKMESVAKMGGWEYNLENELFSWTSGMYHLFNLEKNEYTTISLEDGIKYFHPDDHEAIKSAIEVTIKTGKPFELELRHITEKGKIKWFWATGQAEFKDKKVALVFGSIMDITESKTIQNDLIISENNFREIFNSTNESILITDSINGNIIDVNQRTLEMYEYSTKYEIIGKNVIEISANTNSYSSVNVKEHIQNTIEKKSHTFEWLARKKTGDLFWVEISLRYVRINKEDCIISVVRDISARKKSEEELLQLNKKLIAIFKTSKPLQYLKTPEMLANEIIHVLEDVLNYQFGAVVLVDSDGFSLIPFALSEQENKGEFIEISKEYLKNNDIQVGKGIVGWVIKNGRSALVGDVTQDSRYKTVKKETRSELCVPIIVDNQVIGAINVETKLPNAFTEIDQRILETMATQIGIAIQNANLYQQVQKELSERIKIEEELRELNQKLEIKVDQRTKELNDQVNKLDKSQKAMLYMVEDLNDMTIELSKERQKLEAINKELESFSYTVSHDLRAPLRAINGFSKIIAEDYSQKIDSEGQRLLNLIRENSQKMDKLIIDLLALSRVSRNEMNFTKIDMATMALSMYKEVATEEDIKTIKITINNLPEAYADSILLKQVWQNLLGNAIKYSKPKPNRQIEVGGMVKDGMNIYYVKDNGVGFNPDYTHKIFEIFQRLHSDKEFEGTGIGLSIVHRIINRHNGKVWAEGSVNVGATIWFALPNI